MWMRYTPQMSEQGAYMQTKQETLWTSDVGTCTHHFTPDFKQLLLLKTCSYLFFSVPEYSECWWISHSSSWIAVLRGNLNVGFFEVRWARGIPLPPIVGKSHWMMMVWHCLMTANHDFFGDHLLLKVFWRCSDMRRVVVEKVVFLSFVNHFHAVDRPMTFSP